MCPVLEDYSTLLTVDRREFDADPRVPKYALLIANLLHWD